VEVRSIFCLLFNYAFPFINLRLQIFTFTKIFWVIASEAVGETAMTLIGMCELDREENSGPILTGNKNGVLVL
jgi:hypothetical protein